MPNKLAIQSKVVKLPLMMILSLPLIMMAVNFYYDRLGANPVEEMTHITGEWALRLLLFTLAISPLRRLLHMYSLIYVRRIFGVFSFIYVLCHFLIYFILDQWFDVALIIEDIWERPYITVGFAAFVLMIPLALTSTNAMQAKLQSAWVKLHKLVYLIAILAILHFWWLVKADYLEPFIYASILLTLFGYRVYACLNTARSH